MRDVAIAAIIFGSLPFILKRPYLGILMWTWLAFMNPHRLGWGFAYDMQFALIVALFTLAGLLLSREPKRMLWTRETIMLLFFMGWITLTTTFAAYPADAWEQLEKVTKIVLMVFVTIILMQDKKRINLLVWVMALSLAFYGVKGGVFTLLNGGVHRVWGPAGSFIAGNNEMALALLMTVPLLRYLQATATNAWLRHSLTAAIILTTLAIVGSQSRGAFVGLIAMGIFFWLKGGSKVFTSLLVILGVCLVLVVMPQQWFDRMSSIQTYEEDSSALGRINAWKMAANMASQRPLGGGFESFRPEMFAAYAPEAWRVHDAHSIYFEVLGEHGFIGLALFLVLAFLTWRSASSIIRRARDDPDMRWAAQLGAMVQVSMVGYASAGAFLGLAYFDFYYTLVAIVVLCHGQLGRSEPDRPMAALVTGQAKAAHAS